MPNSAQAIYALRSNAALSLAMGRFLSLDKSARDALLPPEQPERPTNEVRSLGALLGPLPGKVREWHAHLRPLGAY